MRSLLRQYGVEHLEVCAKEGKSSKKQVAAGCDDEPDIRRHRLVTCRVDEGQLVLSHIRSSRSAVRLGFEQDSHFYPGIGIEWLLNIPSAAPRARRKRRREARPLRSIKIQNLSPTLPRRSAERRLFGSSRSLLPISSHCQWRYLQGRKSEALVVFSGYRPLERVK